MHQPVFQGEIMNSDGIDAGLHRRAFCSRAAVGVAGMMLSTGTVHDAVIRSAAPSSQATWDMSWVERLKAKNRAVFDSPDLNGGNAFDNAQTFMAGYHDVYGGGDADTQAVIILRSRGVHMAFADDIWTKYGLAQQLRTMGSGNPFARAVASLHGRGAIFLACNLATRYYATEMAGRASADAGAVYSELKEKLLPGVVLMPSGIFALVRAQQAGCWHVKSA
jgi:hypothetical protein